MATVIEQITLASLTNTGADTVAGLARTARILVETAERERGRALQAALAWEATTEHVRAQHVIWDADGNGCMPSLPGKRLSNIGRM